MQEIICQAHMAGQHNQSGCDPSWSEALAYYKSLEKKLTALQQLKAKICEWKTTEYGTHVGITTSCGVHRSILHSNLKSYDFCPYCSRPRRKNVKSIP